MKLIFYNIIKQLFFNFYIYVYYTNLYIKIDFIDIYKYIIINMDKLQSNIKKSAYYKSNADFKNTVDDIINNNIICDKKFNKNVEFIFILDNFTMSFNWGAVNEECIIEEKLMKLYDLFE